ncbi:MAG: DNA-protecting protein DprA [Gammaproteobacteria bacterium]|nr:DNA-protecting protein DprA [Gammaproteobacteria bacterium]
MESCLTIAIMDNRTALILLSYAPGIGPKTLANLRHYWPNLAELFNEYAQSSLRRAIPEKLAAILKSPNWQQYEADLRWQESANCHLFTCLDKEYPALLRQIPHPPIRLYAKGELSVLNLPCLSMVGSRKPSAYGAAIAKQWAYALSLKGLCIVSGMALGIDGLAHQGAIAANMPTIAVLGNGVEYIYPHRHRDLAEKIIEKGVLLSEFLPKTAPKTRQFPQRNRIICGLSLITLIIEAAIKSGSMITALHAVEQNREVFAVPGEVTNPLSAGCHYLIQQGAKLVMTDQEVWEEYQALYCPL